MKIRAKDLGPIRTAEIDLNKDLIVLCGPNNTGKTYMLYCLYALSKILNEDMLPNLKINNIQNIIDEGKIQIDLTTLLENNLPEINNLFNSYLKSKLASIYGLDKKSTNKIFPKTEFEVEFDKIEDIKNKILKLNITAKLSFGKDITFDLTKDNNSKFLNILLKLNGNNNIDLSSVITNILSTKVYQFLFQVFIDPSYIVPVERNSIYTFSKELSLQRNILVDKILELNENKTKIDNPFDLLERRTTRYPMPIRDGLEIAEDIYNFNKRESEFADFAKQLENSVLDGQIHISKEGEVQFQPNKAKSIKLPIHLTASIVKSFSSLIIYFKHLAKKNDMIIIDEPELNLHPDAQILVSKIIAAMVNKGFRVVVNTHSDYIIRELNNMIMLDNIDAEQLDEITEDHSKENAINHTKVGAYLFDYDGRKKVNAKRLNVEINGFEVSTIDDVINNLNKRSQELFFKLREMDYSD